MRFELVLAGAVVVDGTGGPPATADVGVDGGRIAAVGERLDGERRVQLDGRVLAPGFVDAHRHTDVAAFDRELAYAATAQGITTEVVGNCGWSAFPCPAGREAEAADYGRALLDGEGAWAARDAEAYLERLAARPTPTNVTSHVGHSMLRFSVMGLDDRVASAAERERMAAQLDRDLAAGAVGLSAGLIYAPSAYADDAELVALLRSVADHDAVYAVHMRNESDRLADNVETNLELSHATGAALHISHLKAAGRAQWGSLPRILERIDEAAERGADVTFDVYPYTQASSLLRAALPPWCLADGVDAMLALLADASARERIRRDLTDGLEDWDDLAAAAGWQGVHPVGLTSPTYAPFDRRDLTSIAAALGRPPDEVLCDILLAERGEPLALYDLMSEGDVAAAVRHPRAMIGSDGIPTARQGHPRLYNTYPRLLGRYVGDGLALEEAVRKCTAAPAARFGLEDVGRIAPGARADLVAFDPSAITEHPRFPEVDRDPAAVDWVLVGGVAVVADGRPTGAAPGRPLRRQAVEAGAHRG